MPRDASSTTPRARISFHRLLGATLSAWLVISAAVYADDWPQWLGPQRDGVWRETGILDKFPKGGPKRRWKVDVGLGYAGPAVAAGRVYVTDWILAKGVANPDDPWGKIKLRGKERVLCVDDSDGTVLWKHEYDCVYSVSYPAGPRTTPVVKDGKVYTLGTMGDLYCLNAKDGKVIWSKNFPKDYKAPVPLWGYAAHPLLDGNRLICLVGGEDSVVMAFDKDNGKELWRALSASEIGYCPPMIYEAGGKRQLIIWHPEAVNSLNPETGEVYWTQPFRSKVALTIPTPRRAGNLLFVTAFYNGPLMLNLDPDRPAASVLWKGKGKGEKPNQTDGLHSIISTPFIKDGYIYGVCSYGELRCLEANTGKRKWATFQATTGDEARWGNAFLVPQGDRWFLFNEQGDLIIARLTPEKYEELDRAKILEPTNKLPGRPVVWSHPAFANRSMYVRNDRELVCVSLAAEKGQ
jgi:outer membrane protein assembly factor BamB